MNQPGSALQTVEMSDELSALTEQDEGLGISFKPEDQLLPLIYVLQGLSPIVNKRGDNYIEGAEPGHFWLRNAANPIRDGEKGIEAIPCEMVRTWIEWLPDRQGFVARHPEPPLDMASKKIRGDDGAEKTIIVRSENGNIIQDTREFYIIVDGDPYVFPCSSTKHTFARQWNTYFKQFKHPKTGGFLPAFSHKYLLTTVPSSNVKGDWFGLRFQDSGLVTPAEYATAKSFYTSVKKGERKIETPIDGQVDGKDGEIPF